MSDKVFLHVRLDEKEAVSVRLEDAPGGRVEAILNIAVGDGVHIAFTGSPWSIDRIVQIVRDGMIAEWCKRWTGKKVVDREGGEEWTIKRCYFNRELGYRVDLVSEDGEALRLGESLGSWRFVQDETEAERG